MTLHSREDGLFWIDLNVNDHRVTNESPILNTNQFLTFLEEVINCSELAQISRKNKYQWIGQCRLE